MKRLYALIVAAALCFPSIGARAWWQSIQQVALSAGGDAPQTTAFLARTSGLSGTETSAYKALINGLVADGTFSLLDVLYIFATNTPTTAKLNLISNTFNATYSGVPAEATQFSADHGYTGNGANVFLNTGYNPFTAGLNYAQSAASAGVYVLNNRTTATFETDFGVFDGGFNNAMWIMPLNAGTNQAKINANSSGSSAPALAGSTAQGMTSFTVTGASAQNFFRNANAAVTASIATTGLANGNVFILGANVGGSLFSGAGQSVPSSDQVAAFFLGGNMTSTQQLNVHSRINAYMTALAINVY